MVWETQPNDLNAAVQIDAFTALRICSLFSVLHIQGKEIKQNSVFGNPGGSEDLKVSITVKDSNKNKYLIIFVFTLTVVIVFSAFLF